MEMKHFPTINLEATGKHIAQLRKERGLSVKDMQNYFGFEAPQAIYKWQNGTALPTVDNLLALSVLLEVSIDSILVTTPSNITLLTDHEPEGSVFLRKNACRERMGFFMEGSLCRVAGGGKGTFYPFLKRMTEGGL